MDFVRINEATNEISIEIVKDGLPQETVLIPYPFGDETEITKKVIEATQAAWLQGCWVEKTMRVKNPAFDEGDVKTTTEMVIRPCMTENEGRFVMGKIRGLVEENNGDDEKDNV